MKYTHQQVTTIIPFPIIKRHNKSFSRCFENGAKWTCKVIFFFFEAIWFLIEILYILAHVHHIYKGNIWLIDLYILRVNLVPLSSWGAFDLRKITRIFLSIFFTFFVLAEIFPFNAGCQIFGIIPYHLSFKRKVLWKLFCNEKFSLP